MLSFLASFQPQPRTSSLSLGSGAGSTVEDQSVSAGTRRLVKKANRHTEVSPRFIRRALTMPNQIQLRKHKIEYIFFKVDK